MEKTNSYARFVRSPGSQMAQKGQGSREPTLSKVVPQLHAAFGESPDE
jgi:hypothetical protein